MIKYHDKYNALPRDNDFNPSKVTEMTLKSLCSKSGRYILLFSSIGFAAGVVSQESRIEEIMVVAEKRDESLQDLSQAVTAITSDDLESRNINSFVDLSALAPGLTVAKNEGFKTVVSIRGVGNETNQNAIAAPSVALHMDLSLIHI